MARMPRLKALGLGLNGASLMPGWRQGASRSILAKVAILLQYQTISRTKSKPSRRLKFAHTAPTVHTYHKGKPPVAIWQKLRPVFVQRTADLLNRCFFWGSEGQQSFAQKLA